MTQTNNQNGAAKFNTFGGVFTPCTLTILGVIMFLRFGQVIGQAGVIYALLIVLASKTITLLTCLSLSAIATNTRVKGGGAYYLISRSLGVEFGGAIGIVFYLAQAISVAMYVIGFTEAFVATFSDYTSNFIVTATAINLITFICVYIGAGWTIKVQYFILFILACSLISFYIGAIGSFDANILQTNLAPHFQSGDNLFTMFALFFPAVTGIMAGANMSGELRNPGRSIPIGTIAAIVITGIIYISQGVLLGGISARDNLVSSTLIMSDFAVWPVLITAGVFAATASSAIGSMMGAPRILQAVSRDNIFSSLRAFKSTSGKASEPRRAILATFLISQVCIMLGDLNAIAPIITMFFMITYGLINLATFYESATKNPSYRPTFKYNHWILSLIGAAGCLAVMFFISWLWAIVSIVIIYILHKSISLREIESHWGDVKSGVAFEKARQSLVRLQHEPYHAKNWRPNILVLSGSTSIRPYLAWCGHWLTAGHGVMTIAQIVLGDLHDHAERVDAYESTIRKFITKTDLIAFPAVVVEDTLYRGVQALVQSHGIGGLRPNTVLMGWPNNETKAREFGSMLRLVGRLKRSVVVARFLEYRDVEREDEEALLIDQLEDIPLGTIDVWWRGKSNGALMMLLAHIFHQNPGWRGKTIRVLRIVNNLEGIGEVTKHILELAASARIPVEPVVLVSENVAQTIQEASKDAALILLGFQHPENNEEVNFYSHLEAFVGDLERVLFVCSAGGVELDS